MVSGRRAAGAAGLRPRGFTVVELIVVLAAIALLLSIAAPRYVQHLDAARDTVLRQDLHAMREAIDRFYGDQSRYPGNLDELVQRRYLRDLPQDPVTQRTDTWVVTAPPSGVAGGVYDVHSGAKGMAVDGSPYAAW